jgi:hypothetical protein
VVVRFKNYSQRVSTRTRPASRDQRPGATATPWRPPSALSASLPRVPYVPCYRDVAAGAFGCDVTCVPRRCALVASRWSPARAGSAMVMRVQVRLRGCARCSVFGSWSQVCSRSTSLSLTVAAQGFRLPPPSGAKKCTHGRACTLSARPDLASPASVWRERGARRSAVRVSNQLQQPLSYLSQRPW